MGAVYTTIFPPPKKYTTVSAFVLWEILCRVPPYILYMTHNRIHTIKNNSTFSSSLALPEWRS
jgi:hypothetical protein